MEAVAAEWVLVGAVKMAESQMRKEKKTGKGGREAGEESR